MKKIVIAFTVIVMTFCTFLTVHTTPESFITLGYATCIAGENVDVPITFTDNPGIAALYFQVFYDTDLLTLSSVEDKEIIDDFQYYDNDGTVTLSWEPATDNVFAEGQIAVLHFSVNESAPKGPVFLGIAPLEHGIIDKFGNDADVNLIEGTVQIERADADIFSSTLAIDKKNNYISFISAGTTCEEIISQLNTSEGISIKKDGTLLASSDKVATGATLTVSEDGSVIKEYTLIVTGDNSGDGQITVKDMLNARSEANSPILSDVYRIASDVNGDKKVDSTDFDIIKSHILHNTKIVGIAYT